MNKTLKAADEVRKLHRMFAALGEVVAVMDKLGSLEQAESEANARIDALNTQAEQLRLRAETTRAEAHGVVADADKYAVDTRAACDDMLAKAKADAARLVEAAQAEAGTITQAAMQAKHEAEVAARIAADAEAQATAELDQLEERSPPPELRSTRCWKVKTRPQFDLRRFGKASKPPQVNNFKGAQHGNRNLQQ